MYDNGVGKDDKTAGETARDVISIHYRMKGCRCPARRVRPNEREIIDEPETLPKSRGRWALDRWFTRPAWSPEEINKYLMNSCK